MVWKYQFLQVHNEEKLSTVAYCKHEKGKKMQMMCGNSSLRKE